MFIAARTLMRVAVPALLLGARALPAQIRVSPTGVSTNAMNPSTVFLTFAGLRDQVAAEGIWCGEVVPAAPPARGTMCDPTTVYGRLPVRSTLLRADRDGRLTDIMSIPASVARRAYLDGLRGARATFFYVRRFTDPRGGPDEYVAVTCRLTGGGAGTPFALTDVVVAFESGAPVAHLPRGDVPPAFSATIRYNGSGLLRGRWEVVLPGEVLPEETDLLTEATLPAEERGRQRRYTQLSRFALDVPPGGRLTVPGPDVSRLPRDSDGAYLVLLRIEASDDRFGDSEVGTGTLHNGAVAGFPLPVLRYVVGSTDGVAAVAAAERSLLQLRPLANAEVRRDSALVVSWTPVRGVSFYRVEFETSGGERLLQAVVRRGTERYVVPPTVAERAGPGAVRWRVVATDAGGGVQRRTPWRTVRFAGP